jgi:stage II sporulation protein D
LGLFHPKELLLRAPESFAGEAILTAHGDRIRLRGIETPAVTASGPVTLAISKIVKRTHPKVKCRVHARGGELVPVLELDTEDAVAAVVAAEMPGAPIEAQKAQAVAARTYYTALAPRHSDFDFCDTTHCQLFQDPPASHEPATATRGLILQHHQHLFGAMYFRSCAGRTLTAEQVQLNPVPYPYFAVECPACARNPHRWRASVTAAEAAGLPSENARLKLARKYGWNTIASNSFTASHDGDAVQLNGAGHGHGLGLCQRGAIHLARQGHGFRAILAHYYPQTELSR